MNAEKCLAYFSSASPLHQYDPAKVLYVRIRVGKLASRPHPSPCRAPLPHTKHDSMKLKSAAHARAICLHTCSRYACLTRSWVVSGPDVPHVARAPTNHHAAARCTRVRNCTVLFLAPASHACTPLTRTRFDQCTGHKSLSPSACVAGCV